MDKYKSIDLFAGIGGMRLGFELTGSVKNVFSAENNKYSCETYKENFSNDAFCDITKLSQEDIMSIPDFDLLLAGFPCQAFSIAGKKNGFDDVRGTLFFDIARILDLKRPKAFLLENVKGLTHHDKGKTFNTIIHFLKSVLKYNVFYKVLNSKNYGVSQNRERIYIVGFKEIDSFIFPPPKTNKVPLKSIIEKKEVSSKYYLSQQYLNTLEKHKNRHKSKGNGFGYEILDQDKCANAIVVGGMGKERNLIIDERLTDFTPKTNIQGVINNSYVRRLTPREWARLQGFPDSFKIPVSDTQAYKQFGNSVSVPVIKAIAEKMIASLDKFYPEDRCQTKKVKKLQEIEANGANYILS